MTKEPNSPSDFLDKDEEEIKEWMRKLEEEIVKLGVRTQEYLKEKRKLETVLSELVADGGDQDLEKDLKGLITTYENLITNNDLQIVKFDDIRTRFAEDLNLKENFKEILQKIIESISPGESN